VRRHPPFLDTRRPSALGRRLALASADALAEHEAAVLGIVRQWIAQL